MKKYLPTTKAEGAKQTVLRVEVSYQKGGTNIFNGNQERRGYELSVLPVELEKREGYTSEAFMLFGNKGLRAFLLEVKRQSPKAEAQAVELALAKEPEMIVAVLEKSGLVLASTVAA